MKTTTIHSTAAESKEPIEAFRVEKPPVLKVVSAWQSASKPVSPATHNASPSIAVSPT